MTVSNINITKGSIPPLIKYKIVFLGDQAVGKSSIINRFMYDIFDGNQHVKIQQKRPTIGIDFISHYINLQQKTIRLQLWDTAGQQRFRTLIPNYIRDCSVAVIVYDISSNISQQEKQSFNNIKTWLDNVRQQRGQEAYICTLANKIDIPERVVSFQDGKKFAQENSVLYWQVSAKTGIGIQEFFHQMASMLPQSGVQNKMPMHMQPKNKVQKEGNSQNKKNEQGFKIFDDKISNKENKKLRNNCCS